MILELCSAVLLRNTDDWHLHPFRAAVSQLLSWRKLRRELRKNGLPLGQSFVTAVTLRACSQERVGEVERTPRVTAKTHLFCELGCASFL